VGGCKVVVAGWGGFCQGIRLRRETRFGCRRTRAAAQDALRIGSHVGEGPGHESAFPLLRATRVLFAETTGPACAENRSSFNYSSQNVAASFSAGRRGGGIDQGSSGIQSIISKRA